MLHPRPAPVRGTRASPPGPTLGPARVSGLEKWCLLHIVQQGKKIVLFFLFLKRSWNLDPSSSRALRCHGHSVRASCKGLRVAGRLVRGRRSVSKKGEEWHGRGRRN